MQTERQVVAAFFNREDAAENAIQELRRKGFRSDEIGCSYEGISDIQAGEPRSSERSTMHGLEQRSFLQRIEGFFKGEEGYEDRNTGAEEGRLSEGMRVGPMLQIPERYHTRLESGGCFVTVHTPAENRLTEAEQILISTGGEIDRDYASWSRPTEREAVGEHRIQLLSEVLRINKQRIQTGEVRLRKETRTEQQNIEVPVTREELVIERVEAQGSAPAAGEIGSSEEIRVPLSEERVTVEKQPVVREEVKVGKRVIEDTQKVTDQVRHEELKVEEETRLREEETLRNQQQKPRKAA